MQVPHGRSLGALRKSNREAVVDALATAGALSRAGIARATGLSTTAVSSLVKQLLEEGSVSETAGQVPDPNGRRGRPATLLRLSSGKQAMVIGVDLGHEHIRIALAEQASLLITERTVVMDVDRNAERALDATAELIREAVAAAGIDITCVASIGIGVPGPVNQQGEISSRVLPGWRGIAPAAELHHRIGLPVDIDNDAYLAALGERGYGAVQAVNDVIYVKIADGVGAGLVLGDQVHRGATGIAGELGHVQILEDGPVCRCGSRGCLETQVSVPKLIELLQPAHHQHLTVGAVLDLERDGDAGVNRVLNDAGRTVGRALAAPCNVLNPAAIVIGGPLAASQAMRRGVHDCVGRYAQPDIAAAVRVIPGQLGEHAEIIGAITLALRALPRP